MLQYLMDIDTRLMLFLNGPHNHFWNGFMQMGTSTYTWIPLALVLAYVVFRNYSVEAGLIMFIGLAFVIFFADHLSVQILRPFFQRMRPGNLENPISSQIYVFANHRGGPYGFPSAHGANAFGFALYFILLLRRRMLSILLLLWATFMCYTRIYLGKHYPGDLLFGAMIGMVGAILVYSLVRYAVKIKPIHPLRGERLPWYFAGATVLVLSAIAPFLPAEW